MKKNRSGKIAVTGKKKRFQIKRKDCGTRNERNTNE
jgi:hypothetical protein